MQKYKTLLSPIKIGKVVLKNRTLFPPISTNFATEDGHLTEKYIRHYERRAEGGVALVIIENVCIDFPRAKHGKFEARIDSEQFLPEWRELVERVHKKGAKISVELTHDGYMQKDVNSFSSEKIEEILEKYVTAADLAFKSGFDMVEIQAAHSLLPNKFLSPLTNQRNDVWGDRTKFVTEIRKRIGEKLGFDFPVTVRLAVDDFKEGGIDINEGKRIANVLVNAGYDMIQADIGLGPKEKRLEPIAYKEGWRSYLAKEIKPLSVPITAIGVIRSPEIAEQILNEKAELVALGRTLLADPDWVNKIINEQEHLVRKCIGCSECIKARHDLNEPIRCGVNPNVGNEISIEKTKSQKVVAVVGCGPAGLEAARILSMRGHSVHLFCKKFGGQLFIASVPPGKEKIKWFIDYYQNTLSKYSNLKIHHGEFTQKEILDINPQAVVIATGVKPIIPNWLKGKKNIFTYLDILNGSVTLQNKKIAVGGGGLVGCETALFLSKENQVTIIEMLPEVAVGMEKLSRNHLINELKENNVKILTNKKILEIDEKTIKIKEEGKSNIETIETEIFVNAFGSKPYSPFKIEKIPTYIIGDAAEVRKIIDAVHEGFDVGNKI